MSPFQIWVRDDFREDFREDSKVYLIESLLFIVLGEGMVAGLHEGRGHVAQHGRGAVVDGRDLLPLVVVAPLDDDVRDEHLLGLPKGI